MKIHGLSLTLFEWSQRLREDEYIFVSTYKHYEPGEKLTSSEVCYMLIEWSGICIVSDVLEFKRFIKRIYGVDLA